MASYATIKNGSSGNDVKKWQNYLISQGYDLGKGGADGIFGDYTDKATKQYQKDKGLDVDGIVGTNTWGSMNTKNTTTPKTTTKNSTPKATTTTPTSFEYDDFKASKETTTADKNRQTLSSQKPSDFSYADYEKSDLEKQAESLLQQNLVSKPGEYQSAWQTQLDDTINKILNREEFSYDLNGDALYHQYKDQFTTQGQQASMDTMGQAAAMTGGYGSSYGQSVGQQTYQGYLQQLNNKIPELYQLALDKYNMEGNELYNQYGLLSDRENQDYGRYRDTVADWNTDRAYYTDLYNNERNFYYGKYVDDRSFKYGKHRDDVADWQNALNRADNEYWNLYNRDYTEHTDDKNFKYGQFMDNINYIYQVGRDAVADEQWQKQFDEAMRQYNETMAQKTGSSGGSSSGGSSSGSSGSSLSRSSNSNSGGGSYDNGSHDESDVIKAQKKVGATQDGKWGADSAAKAKAMGYNSLDEVVAALNGGNDDVNGTYSDAVDYAISEGVPEGAASGIMTRAEWQRHGMPNGTYENYVDAFIAKNKSKSKK